MRMGHMHSDIDQLLALITAFLKRMGQWERPDGVLQHLRNRLLSKVLVVLDG